MLAINDSPGSVAAQNASFPNASKISQILLLDSQPLYAAALRTIIDSLFPEAHILEVTTTAAARAAIARKQRFDLAIVELGSLGRGGADGILELRAAAPKLRMLVLSTLNEVRTINEARMYGAVDVISKMASKEEIAAAIRAAAMVPGVVDDPVPATPPNLRSRLSTLTRSQFHVLRKLRQGKLNKQIAYELGIGETTVKAHMTQVLRKLAFVNRTEVVAALSAGGVE